MSLELANTIELLDELAKRFEHFVYIGQKAPKNEDPDKTTAFVYKYKGGAHHAMGLCFTLQNAILSDLPTTEITLDDL